MNKKFELLIPFAELLLAVTAAAGLWWKFRHRRSWPTVWATVEASKVVEGDEAGGYMAGFTYSFQANGEFYSGEAAKAFGQETKAMQYLAPFPKGSRVLVRYNPANPDVSTLDDSSHPGS